MATVKKNQGYKVIIDYSRSLKKMIVAGKYDFTNSGITSGNFPFTRNGKQEVIVELVHYRRNMESEAVLKDFEANGLHAGTLPELLAFYATYSDKHFELPIVALGSVCQYHSRGNRYVPCLRRVGSQRGLDMDWYDDGWDDHCWFLAIRK